MRSRVYFGETGHCRFHPERHAFTYPIYFLAIDLAELHELSSTVRGFGNNRRNLVSVWDTDYLSGSGSLLAKAQDALLAHGAPRAARITLLTMPRVLGYAFNPVNFYLCYGESNLLETVIAEVNNTFDESHLYVLRRTESTSSGDISATFAKELFVSPFLKREGNYSLSCKEKDDRLDIEVHVDVGEKRVFSSSLTGLGEPLTSRALFRALFRFPFAAWLTMTRIFVQAIQLRFIKGVPLVVKPEPLTSSFTRKGYICLPARVRGFIVRWLQGNPNISVERKSCVEEKI